MIEYQRAPAMCCDAEPKQISKHGAFADFEIKHGAFADFEIKKHGAFADVHSN